MAGLKFSFDRGASTAGRVALWARGERAVAPEPEPVPLPQGRGWLHFDGRIDNRAELWSALPDSPDPLARLSDAALLAAGYQAWGLDLFRRVLGSFALVIDDRRRREAILARDPMGGRSLSYALDSRFLLAATEESTLLDDPRVDGSLDPERLACYFALETPGDGRTFFRGLRQLLPGHLLRVGRDTSELRCFWQPKLEIEPSRTEGEQAEEVRSLLAEAVACRLRSTTRPGVLLSGGLDSTPIAGLASRALGRSSKLLAFSWLFDRHSQADERRHAAEAGRRFGLELHAVRCDDALPLSDLPSWPVHPTTPEQNAYRLFHQRSYERARQVGCQLLLSGMCGDQLYTGGEHYGPAETLRTQPLGRALSIIAREALAGALTRPHWAALLPWSWRLERRARRPERRYPWLNESALALLGDPVALESWAGAFLRPNQALLLLGPGNGHGFAVERYFAAREGLEVAYPLRDRRLVERFLTLPASSLHRRGETRPVLRRAVADLLPASIANRQDKANFRSLFVEGVYRRNLAATKQLLFHSNATWPELVDRRIVEEALAKEDTGTAGVVLWLATSLELWLERRTVSALPSLRLAA